jgi:hypothetical protein
MSKTIAKLTTAILAAVLLSGILVYIGYHDVKPEPKQVAQLDEDAQLMVAFHEAVVRAQTDADVTVIPDIPEPRAAPVEKPEPVRIEQVLSFYTSNRITGASRYPLEAGKTIALTTEAFKALGVEFGDTVYLDAEKDEMDGVYVVVDHCPTSNRVDVYWGKVGTPFPEYGICKVIVEVEQ